MSCLRLRRGAGWRGATLRRDLVLYWFATRGAHAKATFQTRSHDLHASVFGNTILRMTHY